MESLGASRGTFQYERHFSTFAETRSKLKRYSFVRRTRKIYIPRRRCRRCSRQYSRNVFSLLDRANATSSHFSDTWQRMRLAEPVFFFIFFFFIFVVHSVPRTPHHPLDQELHDFQLYTYTHKVGDRISNSSYNGIPGTDCTPVANTSRVHFSSEMTKMPPHNVTSKVGDNRALAYILFAQENKPWRPPNWHRGNERRLSLFLWRTTRCRRILLGGSMLLHQLYFVFRLFEIPLALIGMSGEKFAK